jgi:hypothetical protein
MNVIFLDDDSGDEDLLELLRRTKKRKKTSTSRSPTKSLGNELTSPKTMFGNEDDDDDPILKKDFRSWKLPGSCETSDEEITRPKKRFSPSKSPYSVHGKTHQPIENSDEDDNLPTALNSKSRSPKTRTQSAHSSPRWDVSESPKGATQYDMNSEEEEIFSDDGIETNGDNSDSHQALATGIPLRPRKAPKKPTRSCKNIDDDVLRHRTETRTTPWVRKLVSLALDAVRNFY